MNSHNDSEPNFRKTLSLGHLVAIAFILVSAGPFGQEPAIGSGGAKLAFVGTLCIPFVYSLPLVLISSEQATRMAACGGAIEWARVLGTAASWLNSYARFLRSVFDNALYPVMVCDYLKAVVPALAKRWWRFGAVCLANAFALGVNYLGLESVGWVSVVLLVVILAPFALFFAFAVPEIAPRRVFADYPKSLGAPKVSTMVATIIWQCSGFDTVGALSTEVKNPRTTFPLAMVITIALIVLVYLLPTVAGVSVEPDMSAWKSGAFAPVSKKLPHCGSGWLSAWISVAGACSSLSLLNVALSCTGRELYASGKSGAIPFPSFFSKLHSNFRGDMTPMVSIAFMGLITIPLSFLDFSNLVEWTGLLTVIAQLIQVAVFVVCRFPGCFGGVFPRVLEIQKTRGNMESINDEGCANGSSNDDNNLVYLIRDDDNLQQAEEQNVIDNESQGFVIPGKIVGIILVVVPITAISIYLIVISGWMSILFSFGLIAGMFLLQGLYLFVKWLMKSPCNDEMIENEIIQ